MNPEQTPPPTIPPSEPVPPPKSRRRFIAHLGAWLLMAFVLFALAGVILPVFDQKAAKGKQTRALGSAKQIGLSLKLFATDHDGNFPRAGLPDMPGFEPKDSNAAFAALFPTYATSEKLFGNPLSAYQTRTPDDTYGKLSPDGPDWTLEPGENVYSYVAGWNENSPSDRPLVVDGTDGTGHYTTDRKKRGGVWEGKKAIVIHVDDSGEVATLAGPDHARYVPRHDEGSREDKGNLLDFSHADPGVRLLDPAVDSRGKR